MTIELVATILTTDPALCLCNRSVVLIVRDCTIDMRDDNETSALKYVALDDDIRGELKALHSFIGEALSFSEGLSA
jgi:hypothetical protein